MPKYYRVSDGAEVAESEAIKPGGILRDGFRSVVRDGETVTVSMMMMDSVSRPEVAAVPTQFRDGSGTLRQLYDATNGAPLTMNEDLVASIVAEAGRLGMGVDEYLKNVARYTFHASRLGAGHLNPQREPTA